ncbi:MAG: type II secretion system minor pseudopilin GspK [Sedimentisphaerales bacterium]|nr:type II secretion system minor pseudopilin GspK [Sedimentisphaerales bacterium]
MHSEHSSVGRPGIALIVVLLIVAVIAAVVFEFCYESRVRFHLAENTRSGYQALYCAEAGLAVAMSALEQSGSPWADETLAGILSGAEQIPVGKGYCTVSVTGEQGRINVNGLVARDGKPVRRQVDRMLRLIDVLNAQRQERTPISYSLVAAIIDWIDADDETTVLPYVQGENTGAESEYYRSLEVPYRCKNQPLEVVSELLFVKGMTPEILCGLAAAEQTGPSPGIGQFLTVYGDGRVNVNEASAIVLQSLSEQIDPALAETIVQHRPYRNLEELRRVPGMTPGVLQVVRGLATMQSGDEYYTVTARGAVGNCVRTLRLAVRRDRIRGRLTPLIRWEM